MITALAARWLVTVVFAAAGLAAALPRRGAAPSAGRHAKPTAASPPPAWHQQDDLC